MSRNQIDYDPDAVDGDDDGFYQSGDDDGVLGNFDDGDDDDGGLIMGDDDDDDDGDIGFADDTPEDTLNGKWSEAKENLGEAKLKALEELVKEEKTLMGDEKTNAGFKAIKHIILLSVQLGKLDQVNTWYKKWVDEYAKHMKQHLQAVPKLLNKIIEYPDLASLVTLSFKNITDKLNKPKLLLIKASSLLKRSDALQIVDEIKQALDEAHAFLKTPEGADDNEGQANLLLELYAQKIILADKRRNNKDLKFFFEKADQLTKLAMGGNAVLGTIYSVGGRARMRERKFGEATKFLVEAVKNWDQCRRKQETEDCIKLMVISSLLSTSKVNPFDDQVAASHLGTPSIKAFERITRDVLTKNADSFLQNIKPLQREEIVKEYLPMLKRLIQKDLFLEVVKPYTNISMTFVGKRIHTTPEETESILVELILNQQIHGTIDQASGMLLLDTTTKSYNDFYGGLNRLANGVDRIQRNVLSGLS